MSADRDSWLSRTVPVVAASQRTPLDAPASRVEEYHGETMAVVADTPDDHDADLRLSRLLECVRWWMLHRAPSLCVGYLACKAPIEDADAWFAVSSDTAGVDKVFSWIAMALSRGDIETAAQTAAGCSDVDAWASDMRADMARSGSARWER